MADNAEIVERGIRAYNEDGVDALIEFVHPEFEMTTPPGIAAEPDTYRGRDGVRRYFESFLEIMDEVRIEPTEIVGSGNDVLIRFNLVARGKATGIEVDQKAYGIWEIDDGMLRGIRFFPTDEELRSAFGAGGGGG